jgi:hypothetical protein
MHTPLFLSLVMVLLPGALSMAIAQEPPSCDASRYSVRLEDVDDRARVFVNEEKIFETFWGKSGIQPGQLRGIGHRPGDSGGWQDITAYLKPGRNDVRVALHNVAMCCSTAVRIFVRRDDTLIFQRIFRKSDSSAGIKVNETVVIERQECATATHGNT